MGNHTEYNLPLITSTSEEIILVPSDIPSEVLGVTLHGAQFEVLFDCHTQKNKLGPGCLPLTDNHD